jgi:hypothetical protein
MTKQELERQITAINNELNTAPEAKAKRIGFLNKVYSDNQTRMADAAKQKQQSAEASLKNSLRNAYMQNVAATDEDFERDYPILKSDYLRGEAMKKEAVARESQARAMRETF